MTNRENRILNRIHFPKQTLFKDNKGSAIVMVLVAIAFVSIMGSMLMYSTYYNYKMKVVDRKAKDSFYSADQAMDEIRVGLKKSVSEAFSQAYAETMEQYSANETLYLNEYMTNSYRGNLISGLKSDANAEKYNIDILKGYLSKPADNKGDVGAYLESGTCDMLTYTDGVRLKDVKLTYTDEEGYVSVIETDFLLAYPNLGLGGTYEFPDIDEYCLIADKSLMIGPGDDSSQTQGVRMTGSVYGGKNGIAVESAGMLVIQDKDESGAKFITDGDILLGDSKDDYTPIFATADRIQLWAKGITLNGVKSADNKDPDNGETVKTYNLALLGDSYIQDDITVNSDNTEIYLAGTYTGFGNTTTKALNSSAIIVNGSQAVLNMADLKELNLGGNVYIATSNQEQTFVTDNEDIKMGNAVASKVEQLAYLVPAECIGYDVVNGKTIVGKNPVNVKDESYVHFMGELEKAPSNYKEVNLNIYDENLNKPLSNYGATYEKVYFKPDSDTVWAYYYLKFNSTVEAGRFFADYYNASPEEINKYMDHYINTFTVGTMEEGKLNIVGNMITRDEGGNATLIQPTIGEDNDDLISMNQKYVECSNKFMSLSKKLTENYANLSAKERKAGVYENIINTELIVECVNIDIFTNDYILFRNSTESDKNMALLILGEGEIELQTAINEAAREYTLSNSQKKQIGLIVSEKGLKISSEFEFEGTIITKESMIINGDDASFVVTDHMQDVMTATYSYGVGEDVKEIKALSLFRDSKDSDISDDAAGDDSGITADKLVIYENWTKK